MGQYYLDQPFRATAVKRNATTRIKALLVYFTPNQREILVDRRHGDTKSASGKRGPLDVAQKPFSGTLQFKRSERDALRGQVKRAAEGEFARTAAKGFFGGYADQVRIIVLLGDVREDQVARAAVKEFGIG